MVWMTGVQNLEGARNFFIATASRLALVPTQPPVLWLSPGVKHIGHEADCSHPSGVKVKNAWSYTSALPYIFMVWCLVKYKMHLHGVVFS
jgi:hypothetical protein